MKYLEGEYMCVLGVESSCDDSALSLFCNQTGICGEWVSSQTALHQAYGGVVPDLASREHIKNFPILLNQAAQHPFFKKITHIAVTQGPGLAPALAIGVSVAKTLSLCKNIPLFGINHLKGHAFSPFIPLFQKDPSIFKSVIKSYLPHLGLIASGGNTILFSLNEDLSICILAQTVDDAAGEALDKGARLLGLSYPGGPQVEKIAIEGDPNAYSFPRAMQNDIRFSFSGLKTALRYSLEKIALEDKSKHLSNLCASYQQAVIDQLMHKTMLILNKKIFKSLGLSGGVANNLLLRENFTNLAKTKHIPLLLAKPAHSGDNASMIAFALYLDKNNTHHSPSLDLPIYPSMCLDH